MGADAELRRKRAGRGLLPRGIFVRLLLILVLIGVLPFAAMSWWTYSQARERMTQAVIEHWLVRLSREVAVEIDLEIRRMRGLVRGWVEDGTLKNWVEAFAKAETDAERERAREALFQFLRNCQKTRGDVVYTMVLDAENLVWADSVRSPEGEMDASLMGSDLDLMVWGESLSAVERKEAASEREWLVQAFDPRPEDALAARDWHLSYILYEARRLERPEWSQRPRRTKDYQVGFAGCVLVDGEPSAVIAVLFSCERIQGILDDVTQRFVDQEERDGPKGRYKTGYPFLFASDANTVIAHHLQKHLGDRLIQDLNKARFAQIMRTSETGYGSHRYDYPIENPKIAGFARCASVADSGFGWVISVGIDSQDIYRDVHTFAQVFKLGVVGLAIGVVLIALFFSSRLSRPILRLAEHTRLLARGQLDARIDLKTGDEIEVLARAFNNMAQELQETSQRLIHAEKDAAWKEMARQVAHEIKNPLTPIMLSAQQLQRAHADRHPAFEEILSDATTSIIEQCRGLERIAKDFMAYARLGGNERRPHAIAPLLEELERFFRPSAEAQHFSLTFEDTVPAATRLVMDPEDFKRLLMNLISNSIEALREGRPRAVRIETRLASRAGSPHVRLAVRDTGIGIPREKWSKLFEPWFSERTGGTGLGLAICKKIVDDLEGAIEIESVVGLGTTMTVWLPVKRGEREGSPPPRE